MERRATPPKERYRLFARKLGTLTYGSDADGRRVTWAHPVTTYQYDGSNPVESWITPTSPETYLLGLGLDELFSSSGAGITECFLRDALNSTVALTSSTGSIVDQPVYDPYGNTADNSLAFGFAGREDDGSSFYFMRARYYDAAIARFISRDRIGLAGGINMYEYAGDDPVDLLDPLGLLNFVLGRGFSVAAGGAVEGSGGVFVNPGFFG